MGAQILGLAGIQALGRAGSLYARTTGAGAWADGKAGGYREHAIGMPAHSCRLPSMRSSCSSGQLLPSQRTQSSVQLRQSRP
eukprot:scaffold79157_cov20-Tisochrysis_lutea.AAC.4